MQLLRLRGGTPSISLPELSIALPISLDILALNSNYFIKCWLRNIKKVVLTVGLKSYGAQDICPGTVCMRNSIYTDDNHGITTEIEKRKKKKKEKKKTAPI